MIPDRDYYADKDGKLTDDPDKYARQIAVRGFYLDPRIATRYGITDTLVSTDEPNAPRRVTGRNQASVVITENKEQTEPEPKTETSEAKAPEPQADEAKTEEPAKKAEAKKGAKKK